MAIEDDIRDPVVTDGDKYSVVLENERVRVLRYHDNLETEPNNTLILTMYCMRSHPSGGV
jgi:hypothetical protein